jgi:hypothetical protein
MPKSVWAIFLRGVLRPLGGFELPENMEVCIHLSERIGSADPASLIDTDFLADCRDELAAGDSPTLEEARRILSKIPGSFVSCMPRWFGNAHTSTQAATLSINGISSHARPTRSVDSGLGLSSAASPSISGQDRSVRPTAPHPTPDTSYLNTN